MEPVQYVVIDWRMENHSFISSVLIFIYGRYNFGGISININIKCQIPILKSSCEYCNIDL